MACTGNSLARALCLRTSADGLAALRAAALRAAALRAAALRAAALRAMTGKHLGVLRLTFTTARGVTRQCYAAATIGLGIRDAHGLIRSAWFEY
jgi:hypothetical protein